MKFTDLGLAEPLVRALAVEGYAAATPIQAQSIPHMLAGKDVLGSAQTGTGKTAAFALPILQRLSGKPRANASRGPRALVLCPTRELASQIADSFQAYGRHTGLRYTVVFGGVGQNPQVHALRAGTDVLIATPGRLLDLMNQGHVDLRSVEVLVLDEADRMMDMGFIHDIRKVVAKLPPTRQSLLFSATMPTEIRKLADTILRNPVSVQVAAVSSPVQACEQSVYFVEKRNKPALLAHLYAQMPMSRVIVFTRTKHGADRVVRHLQGNGIRAEAIHGNKSQNVRQRALANFKANKTPVLVATDIASRGIDVDGITHVVNYDISDEPETYVHRIGRTARAGASGVAVSFCDPEEVSNLKAIERLIRKSIAVKKDHPTYAARPADDHKRQTPGSSRGDSSRGGFSAPRERHRDANQPAQPARRSAQHANRSSQPANRSVQPQKHDSQRRSNHAGANAPRASHPLVGKGAFRQFSRSRSGGHA